MKRFVIRAAALVAFTSSAFAQINTTTIPTRLGTPTYTLQLTASPSGQVAFGNPVTLTARVMELPPYSVPSAAVAVPVSRLRFTFKAQMTSPCPGMNPINIGTAATTTWNPPQGGTYTITAHVTPVISPLPVSPKLPDSIADATLTYTVTGARPVPSGLPYASFISTPVVPPSGGATAPADVTITANLNAPPYPARYKMSAGCETAGGTAMFCNSTQTQFYPTVPPVTFHLHLPASGIYYLSINGLVFRESDCQATMLIYTHTNQYIVH